MKRFKSVESVKEEIKKNPKINILNIEIPLSDNKDPILLKDVIDETYHNDESLHLNKEKIKKILTLASLSNKERKEVVKNKLPLPVVSKEDIKKIPLHHSIQKLHLGQNGGLTCEIARTITVTDSTCVTFSHDGKNSFHGVSIRHLHERELEALQGYKRDHTRYSLTENGNIVENSRRQRRTLLGNGVSSPVSNHVLKHLKEEDENLKFASFFSGCGGLEANFSNNVLPVSFCDIGELQRNTLRFQSIVEKNVKIFSDITSIDPKEVPDHDLCVGGFPCQPYSRAGKSEGENDLRGLLVFNLLEIIKEKKPKYIIFENVKGILEPNHRALFVSILENLSSLGYEVNFELLNSKNFSLAQTRDRVFIYARLG